MPPLAFNVAEYAVPTVAPGSEVVVMATGFGAGGGVVPPVIVNVSEFDCALCGG